MGNAMSAGSRSGLAAFLRLWVVLLFSYTLIRFLCNLALWGFVDASPQFVQEMLFVPSGQSIVFWLITRRRRVKV